MASASDGNMRGPPHLPAPEASIPLPCRVCLTCTVLRPVSNFQALRDDGLLPSYDSLSKSCTYCLQEGRTQELMRWHRFAPNNSTVRSNVPVPPLHAFRCAVCGDPAPADYDRLLCDFHRRIEGNFLAAAAGHETGLPRGHQEMTLLDSYEYHWNGFGSAAAQHPGAGPQHIPGQAAAGQAYYYSNAPHGRTDNGHAITSRAWDDAAQGPARWAPPGPASTAGQAPGGAPQGRTGSGYAATSRARKDTGKTSAGLAPPGPTSAAGPAPGSAAQGPTGSATPGGPAPTTMAIPSSASQASKLGATTSHTATAGPSSGPPSTRGMTTTGAAPPIPDDSKAVNPCYGRNNDTKPTSKRQATGDATSPDKAATSSDESPRPAKRRRRSPLPNGRHPLPDSRPPLKKH